MQSPKMCFTKWTRLGKQGRSPDAKHLSLDTAMFISLAYAHTHHSSCIQLICSLYTYYTMCTDWQLLGLRAGCKGKFTHVSLVALLTTASSKLSITLSWFFVYWSGRFFNIYQCMAHSFHSIPEECLFHFFFGLWADLPQNVKPYGYIACIVQHVQLAFCSTCSKTSFLPCYLFRFLPQHANNKSDAEAKILHSFLYPIDIFIQPGY